MSMAMILVVVFCLGGIILLNAKSPFEKKTRKQFLEELASFVDGTLEPIKADAGENSFRIKFRFKDQEFIYEDMEKQGFKDKVYKSYLKTRVPNKLTLTFTEKKRSTTIKTDIFISSDISTQYLKEHVALQVPKYLKDLKVFTNDPVEANKIFEDKKTVSVLKKFKNIDSRGYPFVSIEIVKGEVTLEFRSIKTCYPNVFDLRGDVSLIDNHLEEMMVVIRKFKEF
ncbi:MAG: hypothetical protein KAR31_06270 [Candidatus Omnitrophica bacterium]|nr:hypothetical protein [Candidatus Omnitrophota bacterium]MCK5260486.1 hypothetical protein [Candidatus Omnitrophota bacterium]